MNNNLFPVSKYGFKCIITVLGLALLFLILRFESLAILLILFSVAISYIYRNPERELPVFEDKSVIAPVDGEVVSIEELDNTEYLYKITIDSSFIDVGVLRAPMTSKVVSFSKVFGARLCKSSKLSSKINENATIVFEDKHSNSVKVSHTLKQSLCSLGFDDIKNKEITQSIRYGVMVNGITHIYLPQNFRLNINVADNLKASETLVGYFS